MKKSLLTLLGAGLLLTSCQSDEPFAPGEGGEKQVTFTLNVPGELGTRAAAGLNQSDKGGATNQGADQIKYTLVLQANNDTQILNHDQATVSGTTATFKPTVVLGREYTITAYASLKDAWNGVNPIEITNSFNDESKDAYFKTLKYNFANGDLQPLTLTRPYGKLRLIAEDYDPAKTKVESVTITYANPQHGTFDATTETFTIASENVAGTTKDFGYYEAADAEGAHTIFAEYLPTPKDKESEYPVKFTVTVKYKNDPSAQVETYSRTFNDIPVRRNALTTLKGKFFTADANISVVVNDNFDGGFENEQTFINVDSAESFSEAFENDEVDIIVLDGDINLNDILTRAENDPTYTINSGKTLTIDLNGKKLSATSALSTDNRELFLVKGNLTVKNGTIEYKHEGENMGWNRMSTIFDVTAGGVLNLESVTAKNLGGTDMGFVAHLNNWGEVTLNVENSTLESNYVAVRVFNSGPNMNNVTIKNSTLKGGNEKYAFWVHNYTVADFGTQEKADAQKALLNLNIYNQGNTFSPDVNGIRYGFTNSIKSDAYGITKTVSEDGTEVILGSVIENGLVRRGVAGAEENTTIKKAVVGEGITTLYDRTFRRFYALEEVELPSTLTTIGAAGLGVFQSCTALKNIVLPESVTVLGKGSFQECSSLESINIPTGVTRIESDCLRATGLKSVEFHAGVTYFGAQAFRDCKKLQEVVINAPEFTIEANAFGVMSGTYPGTTIYVVNADMKAYLESTLAYKNQLNIKLISEKQ